MFKILLAFALLANFSSSSFATESSPSTVTLTPVTLRAHLLEGNIGLSDALLRLHDAKDQVNRARNALLPSLNLGGLLTSGGSPTFLLSSVQYLLPFLLPANWFNYQAQKDLFTADILAYRTLQLNAYSSALSLYYTLAADQQYIEVYREQAKDLRQVYEIRKVQLANGAAAPEEVLQAQAQAQMAEARVAQMNVLLKNEIAAIRAVLALPLETRIEILPESLPESDWEVNTDIAIAVEEALNVSPEAEQIRFLEKAAVHQKWSSAFAFVGSASLSSQASVNGTGEMQNASFSSLKGNGSLSLGAGMYQTYKLSQRNIEHIRMRMRELQIELTQTLEAEILSLEDYREQLALTSSAEESMRAVYEVILKKYSLGLTSLVNVLTARSQLLDAGVARIKVENDLNLLRATLHRTLLTSEFAQIPGCFADGSKKNLKHKTLDQYCRRTTLN